MKKLSLKPNAFNKGEVLTRTQLKKVMGGVGSGAGTPGGSNGNPCPNNCKQYCHQNDDGHTGYGTCSPSTGGTSCHNYCCDGTQSQYYWC
ncbi:hypothetical protein [uncultured Pedobacter sp.]|uniref:hypothetical protein n=1 Tax=uncultured Pedobacter sp. TaxID=246139 RepID=UPI0025DF9FB5|nr:hypothetical protein [uncultured Pedobacter sp.]